jgi:hypothetical protein
LVPVVRIALLLIQAFSRKPTAEVVTRACYGGN